MRRLFRRAFSDNRGSTLIETAVAMLVVIPMLLWLFEMCMYCYTTAVLQYAARQGVEYAMTHGTDAPTVAARVAASTEPAPMQQEPTLPEW